MAERLPCRGDGGVLEAEPAVEIETLGARAQQRIADLRADGIGAGDEAQRGQRRARLAIGAGGVEPQGHALGADGMGIAQLALDLLRGIRRRGEAAVELVGGIEERIRGKLAACDPRPGEFRAAIVDADAAVQRGLGQRHDEIGGARLVRRRPQQARCGDPGNVVGEQQRPLHGADLHRAVGENRLKIGLDQAVRGRIPALDGDCLHEALDDRDGEDAVSDALGRDEGAGQRVAGRVILALDRVGDRQDVGELDLVVEQRCEERPQRLRRKDRGAGDGDVAQGKDDESAARGMASRRGACMVKSKSLSEGGGGGCSPRSRPG